MTRQTSTAGEKAMPAIAFQRALPILVTALLIAVIWGAHLHLIPAGTYHFYDEFHTLDRSTGFARHNDWFAVYSLQEVNFRKPPLQYWMTAGLLEAGADLQFALRLPSMIFAVGLLGATACLAGVLLPHRLWAMPGAVLLVACSTMFWRHAL
ncbi:MAG: hypothetical protein AAGC96_11790 [Pseudomonadota bacterium]